ncbi:P63C domain-containing protein [Dyadobacter sp. SG02]|uniref:P63C domain-containing protein n=1 Tax=Dyadobacter sp. SG02 TaxID=1855291 RepID=UPI0008C52A86|nr:P63C domain-containing protein [Dyadobacter sp. SG02]SEI85999.1 P63C domain-containing protein [Dyadobacter sp. SG02]
MSKKLKITNEGELNLNGMIIPCYVLEDGTRVLSGRGMQHALKMVDDLDDTKQISGARLSRYLNQKSLKPFIFNNKDVGHFEPIICYKGDSKINGYEATVLADICDGFLEARKQIHLSPRQQIIADQCEILIRGFARVGIIALVDEATGYQYEREKDELQKILRAYISEEILNWQLTFTNAFYKEIFRLRGWDYTASNIKKRPGVVGTYTNQFVYQMLPAGVIQKLKQNTPKSSSGNYMYRFHQSLTPEVGREHLKNQILVVTTLMSISRSWQEFKDLFARKFGQTAIDFESPKKKDLPSGSQTDNDNDEDDLGYETGYDEPTDPVPVLV